MKKIVLLMTSLFMLVSAIYVSNYQAVEAKEVGAAIQPIVVNYPKPEVIEEEIIEEVKDEIKKFVSTKTFTVEMKDVEEDKQEFIVKETEQEETIIEETETEEIIEDLPEQTLEDVVDETLMVEETNEDTTSVEEVVDKVIEVVERVQNIDFEAKINNLIDKIYNKVDGVLSSVYLYQHAITGGGRTLKFGQDHVVTATILKSNIAKLQIQKVLEYIESSGSEKGGFSGGNYYYSEDSRVGFNRLPENDFFDYDGDLNQHDLSLLATAGALNFIVKYEKVFENGKSYYNLELEYYDIFDFNVKTGDQTIIYDNNITMQLFNRLTSVLNRLNVVNEYKWHAYATLKIEA